MSSVQLHARVLIAAAAGLSLLMNRHSGVEGGQIARRWGEFDTFGMINQLNKP